MKFGRFPVVSFCLWCVLVSSALAAQAPATTSSRQASSPPAADEVHVLNPFTVTDEAHVGYLAQSSLAGSRLKTNLGDLAVPVTAFTPEFIEDVASTTVDELSKFMLSTQTDFPDANQAFFAADSAPLRIRGLPATTYAINYFPTNQRLDLFATERVDQSRGPNSILFGIGSPGGLINISSKRATLERRTGSLTLQTRSTEGLRATLDYNQPVLKDRVSLRLAAVTDDRKTWRHHEYDDQKRFYATGRWRIARGTQLDVEWEWGDIDKSLVAPWVVADAYTPWASAGGVLSATANAAAGIRTLGATNYSVVNTATGEAMNWVNRTASIAHTIDGAQVYLSDFSLVPREATMHAGAAFPQLTDSSRLAAFLSHAFTKDFAVELAATTHDFKRVTYNGSSFAVLTVDTNPTLPTGAPNPNAGRPYLEGFPVRVTSPNEASAVRLSAAYTLDLKRFGHHQIAALAERDWTRQVTLQERLYNLQTPYSLASPDNANNLIRFRTYVDLDGPASGINAGNWMAWPLNSLVQSPGNRAIGADWVNYVGGSADNRFRLDSAMGVMQSRFFNGRLITVAGYRKDWQKAWYSPTNRRAPASGGFTTGAFEVLPYGQPVAENQANNVSASAVLKVLPWLGLAYNHGANSALPAITAALPTATGRAPSPKGRSDDIGVKLDFGQRVYFSALYFETSAERDYSPYAAGDARPEQSFNSIWNAFNGAAIPGPNGGRALDQQVLVNGYTFDTASQGIELELIANPTPNWRLFFNFSDSIVERTNIGLENRSYFAAHRDYWLEGDRGRILLDGSGQRAPVANDNDAVVETVAEAVALIERQIETDYVGGDGERPLAQIPRKLNARTNYSFSSGLLRGWSIGGGARHQSGQVINFITTPSGRTTVYGKSTTLFDLDVRYQNRFSLRNHTVRWSVQMNVNNLFDEDSLLPVRVSSAGQVLNYRLQMPREFIFTTRFSF